MNLFGIHITKAAKPQENRLLANLFWRWLNGREWAKANDETSLLNAYRSWVYVCASMNAATVATVPYKLYAAKGGKDKAFNVPVRKVHRKTQDAIFRRMSNLPMVRKAVEIEEILEHPMLDLFARVNPFTNRSDLFEITDLHQELTGNAYWYVLKDTMGVPAELWTMIPDRVTIVPDSVKFIARYDYRNGADKAPFDPEEVVHFKWPNPKDPYYGMSPLAAVADVYNINQNMNTYENAMFSNNARPEGFFTTEQEIDPITYERLSAELMETWAGIRNSGKTGLLSHGLDFKQVNFSPREMGFLQGRKWTKEEIWNAYNVPTGLMDQNANRANAEAAQFVYMKYGIEPRTRRMEEKINEKLTPMYDERLFIAFEDVVPEDKDFQLREDAALFGIGGKSQNEIRLDRGRDEFEGGNILYAAYGLTPVGTTDNSPLPEPEPEPEPEAPKPGEEEASEEEIEEMANVIAQKVAVKLAGR
jgi:HK97 family phage portal protein